MSYAREENLEATVIATVTEEPRLKMVWDGATLVDVSREFLASNGAPKSTSVHVGKPEAYSHTWAGSTLAEKLRSLWGTRRLPAGEDGTKAHAPDRFQCRKGVGADIKGTVQGTRHRTACLFRCPARRRINGPHLSLIHI